ncbi:hypothetical protein [Rhizobium sp. G21]|uniref:hypothetical protein n=1 Tax=Rhizobium sp. G21 TaxID=2758439 RepID=UPI0016018E3B|nr:hypothetical protein [Rhizobium sp. G21]MBB1247901.1 hypothetical protein [Rhizobium sp. G21]
MQIDFGDANVRTGERDARGARKMMMRMIMRVTVALTLAAAAANGVRADGIAIVQAVEQATGVCNGATAAEAFECARTNASPPAPQRARTAWK